MSNHTTAQNSSTRGFTDLQFTQAVTFVPRPRRQISKRAFFAAAVVLLGLACGGTYFVLAKVLG